MKRCIAGMLLGFIVILSGVSLYVMATERGYRTTQCIIMATEYEVEWEWCIWAMSDLDAPSQVNLETDNKVDF